MLLIATIISDSLPENWVHLWVREAQCLRIQESESERRKEQKHKEEGIQVLEWWKIRGGQDGGGRQRERQWRYNASHNTMQHCPKGILGLWIIYQKTFFLVFSTDPQILPELSLGRTGDYVLCECKFINTAVGAVLVQNVTRWWIGHVIDESSIPILWKQWRRYLTNKDIITRLVSELSQGQKSVNLVIWSLARLDLFPAHM